MLWSYKKEEYEKNERVEEPQSKEARAGSAYRDRDHHLASGGLQRKGKDKKRKEYRKNTEISLFFETDLSYMFKHSPHHPPSVCDHLTPNYELLAYKYLRL